MVVSAKARGNRLKLKHRRFPLTVRRHFCGVQVMENNLPREAVEFPPWKSSSASGCGLALSVLAWADVASNGSRGSL